jgi:hypothetical protein
MSKYFTMPVSRGLARVEPYDVPDDAETRFYNLRVMMNGGTPVRPGRYVRLIVDGELMMSDTDLEKWSNLEVVRQATGDVLIAGLGIGMILIPILAKENVRSVTVIEKYKDVIDVIVPSIPNARKLDVVNADILEWGAPKGKKWDVIYFDIWPDICVDNLKQINLLHRRFCRKKTVWMGSWMQDKLRYMNRRGR